MKQLSVSVYPRGLVLAETATLGRCAFYSIIFKAFTYPLDELLEVSSYLSWNAIDFFRYF